MSCNCKNKVKAINEKYGDGSVEKPKTIFSKIIDFIFQFAFGILCAVIIIVMIVPMLLYVIICIMLGKQASFKIKNLNKFLKLEQQNKK